MSCSKYFGSFSISIIALLIFLAECNKTPDISGLVEEGKGYLEAGDFDAAAEVFQQALDKNSGSCDARFGLFLAKTMLLQTAINDIVFSGGFTDWTMFQYSLISLINNFDAFVREAEESLERVEERNCTMSLGRLPYRAGGGVEPLYQGEFRGTWDLVDAYFLGAAIFPGPIINQLQYVINGAKSALPFLFEDESPILISRPPGDLSRFKTGSLPPLPDELAALGLRLERLFQVLKDKKRGSDHILTWEDRDASNDFSPADRLRVNFFTAGTDQRVMELEEVPLLPDTSQEASSPFSAPGVPPCNYFQPVTVTTVTSVPTETLFQGRAFDHSIITSDGTRVVFPVKDSVGIQIATANVSDCQMDFMAGVGGVSCTTFSCLTCGVPGDKFGWFHPDDQHIVYVSNEAHPSAFGLNGGGMGQELYAITADGSWTNRLTVSPPWSTNYYHRISQDGKRIVWGQSHRWSWDIMLSDIVIEGLDMRLENIQRLTSDLAWYEPHGFSSDGKRILFTSTRGSMLHGEIYEMEIDSRRVRRVTDGHPGWDEHSKYLPGEAQIVWESSRQTPAALERLIGLGLPPILDWMTVFSGTFIAFIPFQQGVAYDLELHIMNTDGTGIQPFLPGDFAEGWRVRYLAMDRTEPGVVYVGEQKAKTLSLTGGGETRWRKVEFSCP